MMARTRAELIEAIAEWLAFDDEAGYWYDTDLMAYYKVGETEVQIINELATDMRDRASRSWLRGR